MKAFCYCLLIGLLMCGHGTLSQSKIPTTQDSILNKIVKYNFNDTLVANEAISPYELLYAIGAAKVYSTSDSLAELVIADMICQNTAHILENQLENETIDKRSEIFLQLQKRLGELQYHVHPQPSDWEKIIHYIGEGRLQYILRKFFIRDYHKHPLIWVGIFIIVFAGWWIWNKKVRNNS